MKKIAGSIHEYYQMRNVSSMFFVKVVEYLKSHIKSMILDEATIKKSIGNWLGGICLIRVDRGEVPGVVECGEGRGFPGAKAK